MTQMRASVCRYKLTRQSSWENGIAVWIDQDIADHTVTIIGSQGNVERVVYKWDELPRYGAFTFDPERS